MTPNCWLLCTLYHLFYCQVGTICVLEGVSRHRHNQHNPWEFDIFLQKPGKKYLLHWRHLIIEGQICSLAIKIEICKRGLFGFGEVYPIRNFELTNERMQKECRRSTLANNQSLALILCLLLQFEFKLGVGWVTILLLLGWIIFDIHCDDN